MQTPSRATWQLEGRLPRLFPPNSPEWPGVQGHFLAVAAALLVHIRGRTEWSDRRGFPGVLQQPERLVGGLLKNGGHGGARWVLLQPGTGQEGTRPGKAQPVFTQAQFNEMFRVAMEEASLTKGPKPVAKQKAKGGGGEVPTGKKAKRKCSASPVVLSSSYDTSSKEQDLVRRHSKKRKRPNQKKASRKRKHREIYSSSDSDRSSSSSSNDTPREEGELSEDLGGGKQGHSEDHLFPGLQSGHRSNHARLISLIFKQPFPARPVQAHGCAFPGEA